MHHFSTEQLNHMMNSVTVIHFLFVSLLIVANASLICLIQFTACLQTLIARKKADQVIRGQYLRLKVHGVMSVWHVVIILPLFILHTQVMYQVELTAVLVMNESRWWTNHVTVTHR